MSRPVALQRGEVSAARAPQFAVQLPNPKLERPLLALSSDTDTRREG